MPRPVSAPPFIPGDRVTVEVLGKRVPAIVVSVDHDPITLEWTYAHAVGADGFGHYKRSARELERGWPTGSSASLARAG